MRNFIISFCLLFAAYVSAASFSPDQALWYTYPAEDWNTQALHVGNGYMGASFYGGIEKERLDIAEKTFWSGGPNIGKPFNYGIIEGGKENIAQIRKLVLEGRYAEADKLCKKYMMGDHAGTYGYFSAVGSLFFNFKHPGGEVSDYVRSLDLENSLGSVSYKKGGTTFNREYFSSYPDKAMVYHFSSDEKGKISFDIDHTFFYRPDNTTFKNNELVYNGLIFVSGLKYCIRIAVIPQGGTVSFVNQKVSINSADEVTVIYTVDTEYKADTKDFKGVNPEKETKKVIENAVKKGYDGLKQTHIADYRNLYSRAKFSLVGNKEIEKLPTNKRFELLKSGITDDSALKALYFNLGRYLLISSSRPGTLPSNLQGVWNNNEWAMWAGNYQSNINLQEMYWSCGPTNLPECQEGYLEWVESQVEPGRKVADAYYGTKGWVSHATGNIWNQPAPGADLKWGLYPVGAAWHCRHLWLQYQYTGNLEYLKTRAYPVMKEAAEFWLENLVEKDGQLLSIPSTSAEHGIQTENGEPVKYSTTNGDQNDNRIFTVPNFQDIQMVHDLFSNVIKAADLLNADVEFKQKVAAARGKLPALKIGKYGQLQEWLYDYDNARDHHRHIAHLYAVYPGEMISVEKTPELAEAAKVSLNMRDEGFALPMWELTGGNWSAAWRSACWAHLNDGERAIKVFNLMNKENGYENLMNSQIGYMQVDASMATPGIFAEMLLQSDESSIHLLPALPAEWPEGKIEGFLTKGGNTINMAWEYGQLKSVRITVPKGKTISTLCVKGKSLALSDSRIQIVNE